MAKAKTSITGETTTKTTGTGKQLLKLARKDAPGNCCIVLLDDDGNVSLREEDSGHEIVRLLPETLKRIHAAVMAETRGPVVVSTFEAHGPLALPQPPEGGAA